MPYLLLSTEHSFSKWKLVLDISIHLHVANVLWGAEGVIEKIDVDVSWIGNFKWGAMVTEDSAVL